MKLGTEKSATASQTAAFDSGKSTLTVGSDKYTVTSGTVFLYWNDNKVTRFEGKSAPDLTGTKTISVVDNRSDEAEVVFVVAAAANQFDDNFLYVYKTKIGENSDGYEVSAILKDGTITTITVDSASYINNPGSASTTISAINTSAMTIVPGMYNYSKDGDVYTLNQVDGNDADHAMDYVASGTVTGVSNDYVKIGDTYTLKNTVVVYGQTNKDAEADEVITKGDIVTVVYNDDAEAVFVVITKRAADEYSVALTGGDASNKLSYTVNGATNTVADGDLIPVGTELTVTAASDKMVKVTVNGNVVKYLKTGDTYTMTAADTTFAVVAKPTVTVADTQQSANNVTAAATAISGTAHMPGDEVTVTVTLGGTAASDKTIVTITGVTGGTYAGTPANANVDNTGVTVANGNTASGTFTYTFTMGDQNVTPTVSVASAQ